jgi:hypothetical protein
MDSFSGTGSHEFEWFFHASPGTEVEQIPSGAVFRAKQAAVTLLFDDGGLQCENTDGWYSPSYGIRERTPVLVLRARRTPPFEIGIRIINSYAPDFRHQ